MPGSALRKAKIWPDITIFLNIMLSRIVIFFLKRILIPLIVLIMIMSGAKAQINEESEKVIDFFTRLDIAYIIGGQIYNDNFLYNPGLYCNWSKILESHYVYIPIPVMGILNCNI